tara:strand:- start:1154 stop:1393 length:240 start_codon:yes stop_codon:yes gene_type:complete
MDSEFIPEEEDMPWCLELRMGINETKMMYNCIRIYSNLIDIDDEETEEKKYMNTLKNKFFAVISDYNYQKQFPDSKTDL